MRKPLIAFSATCWQQNWHHALTIREEKAAAGIGYAGIDLTYITQAITPNRRELGCLIELFPLL